MPDNVRIKHIYSSHFEKDNSHNELIGTNMIFGTSKRSGYDDYGPYYAGVYKGRIETTNYLPNKANADEPSTKYYIDLSSCHAMSGNCYMYECTNCPDCKHPWEPKGSSEQIFHIPTSKLHVNISFSQDLKLDELMRVFKTGHYASDEYGEEDN